MSDGNFNRTLLPRHDYQSGVRAGRAAMRTRAVAAFTHLLQEARPDAPAADLEAEIARFKALLDP